jgi:uncharacterized membrane protein (GlpM family)
MKTTTNILIVVFICYFLFLGSLFYYAASNDVTGMYIIGMFELLCTLALIVLYLHKKDLKRETNGK